MKFSNIITINDALIITAFSMALVFVTLIVISFILDGLKVFANKKNNVIVAPVEPLKKNDLLDNQKQEDDLELIAVITASIAAVLSTSTSSIVVKNIVRLPQSTPVWNSASRQ